MKLKNLLSVLSLSEVFASKEKPKYKTKEPIPVIPYHSHHEFSPEFHPKRTKFKGWMRENRKSTFNKNR